MPNEPAHLFTEWERAPVRPTCIYGQLLRFSDHREVALYVRDGVVGVADFIDGHGTLVDVKSWLRFNCGTPANTYVVRRMKIESAIPLSAELSAQIDSLYRPALARRSHTLIRLVERITALLPRGLQTTRSAPRFHRRSSHQAHRAS